jgi:phenylpyruvate tautomerase PptA (4-oxalocrotonate tautomerase family)
MAEGLERDLEELIERHARELARDVTALLLRRLGLPSASSLAMGPQAAPNPRATGSREVVTTEASAAPNPDAPPPPPTRTLLDAASHPPARSARRERATKPDGAPVRHRSTLAEKAHAIERVAEVIGASDGLSLGEIERAAGLPRPVVASAIKALKDGGRVFMGGTKRLARYATTLEVAERASEAAARK